MILSDKHRLGIFLIPKCAGTAVWNALMPVDERIERYYASAVSKHAELGLVDHPHNPLALLRDYSADIFRKLITYRSFALVRETFLRFPSSLRERFVQWENRSLSVRNLQEVAREAEPVMVLLAAHSKEEPLTEPELIQFSRQHDCFFLEGRQIGWDPRTVKQSSKFLEDVSERTRQLVQSNEPKNQRVVYSDEMVPACQKAITVPIKRMLPNWIWKRAFAPTKFAFRAAGVRRADTNDLSVIPNFEEIKSFISEFYVDALALFKQFFAEEGCGAEKCVSCGAGT